MKRLTSILALSLLFTLSSYSQIRIGAGIITGEPTGDGLDELNMLFGAEVNGQYFLNENVSVGLSIGYMSASYGGIFDGIDASQSMLPIHIRGQYHFNPNNDFSFYTGLGLGMNFNTLSVFDESTSGSGFATTFRGGANYIFESGWGLDLNLGYCLLNTKYPDLSETSFDESYIPINIGVFYTLE